MTSSRLRKEWSWLLQVVVVLLGLGAYANTFNAPMVFDDQHYLTENSSINNISYFLDDSLAKRAIAQLRLDQNFLTRKVSYLSFTLNFMIHGYRVFGYHLVNLLVHLLNGLLLYRLVLATMMTPLFQEGLTHEPPAFPYLLAFMAALLFVVHPVQTEAVSYIIQRFTSLATLFYLLAILLYVRWRLADGAGKQMVKVAAGASRGMVLYLGALLSAFLAMYTKEISFTLPVMILLYEFVFFQGSPGRRLLFLLPFLAAMAIIPAIVFDGGNDFYDVRMLRQALTSPASGDSYQLTYLFTQFRVVVTYLRLLLLPINQNLDYDYPLYPHFLVPPVVLSFAGLCLLVALGAYLYHLSSRLPSRLSCWLRLISFGICWFVVTLAVESSFMPLKDVIFEHRVYLPAVGVFVALLGTIGILRCVYSQVNWWPLWGVLAVVLVVLTAATRARNELWSDPVALWRDAVRQSPGKFRPHYNLGLCYKTLGRFPEAIDQFDTAIKVASAPAEQVKAYLALNDIYAKQRNQASLASNTLAYREILLKGIKDKGPDQPSMFNNLAVLSANLKQYPEAEAAFRKAIELDGNISNFRNSLGRLYYAQNRLDEAAAVFKASSRIDPDNYVTQQYLGDVLAKKGEYAAALAAYLKARDLAPVTTLEIQLCVATQYAMLHQAAEEAGVLSWARTAWGRDPWFYVKLGKYFEKLGRLDDAERTYTEGIGLAGDFEPLRSSLRDLALRPGKTDQ